MRGFVPARRVPFVSAKGTQTMFARARPCGSLPPPSRIRWFGNSLRVAKPPLRSNSHRRSSRIRGGGPAALNAEISEKIFNLQMKEFGRGRYGFPMLLTDSGGCPTCSEVQSHLSPQRGLAELPDSKTLRGPCRKVGREDQLPLVLLKIVLEEELPYNF